MAAVPNPEPSLTLAGAPVLRLRPARSARRLGVLAGLLLAGLALAALGGRGDDAVRALVPLFPGYGASWLGALSGAGYGFAAGAAAGWLIATIYNRLAR